MKCFLCGGELRTEFTEFKNTNYSGYWPYCPQCGMNRSHSKYKLYPTPEAALEAMIPKVDEELVDKVHKITRALHDHWRTTDKIIYVKDSKEFIKQELEKFWREG